MESGNAAENLTELGEGQEQAPEPTLKDKVEKNPALLDFIARKAEEIIAVEAQVKTLNEKKKLIREEVVEKGINRHGFAAAVSRKKLTETDREERELSYMICCRALDVQHTQLDLNLESATVKAVE